MPPKSCGFDNSGIDKLCCSDLKGKKVNKSQPPKYHEKNSKPFPCIDHAPEHCKRWKANSPKSCSPGHSSYIFMRLACQKTCDICGSEVTITILGPVLLLSCPYLNFFGKYWLP